MSYTSPEDRGFGSIAPDRPHAYDPAVQPEYFEGVLSRRLLAFAIDAVIIIAPIVLLAIFIFVFGIVTLSLGWMLFPVLGPAFAIWAVWYNAVTLGSPASATLGMRAMDIEMRTWYGAPAYSLLGAVHALAYWISVSVCTPLILLVALFNGRRRQLHDFLVGTVIVNNEARAEGLRRRRF
ncbi:MAG: RDD family protein [Pseudomonadota bacterium]